MSAGSDGPREALPQPLVGTALLWHVAVVVALTAFPFGPSTPPEVERAPATTNVGDVAGNLVLFVPFAASVAASLRGRRSGTWGAIWIPVAACAAASTCVEVGQRFIESRVASPLDVLLNTTGALLASLVARRALDLGLRPTVLLVTTIVPVLTGAILYVVSTALSVSAGIRVAAWDPGYPIVAADEAGADRRYEGTVEDARICAGEVCLRPAAAPDARSALVAAAEESQSVSLSATVRSSSDAQTGPTRIVSFSHGAYDRNATLGQEGRSLVFRIRTPWTGANGRQPEFVLRDAVEAGTPTRVTATYHHGSVTIRADAAGRTRTAVLRTGLLGAWFVVGFTESDRRRTGVDVCGASRAVWVAAIVLATPIGMLVGYRAKRRQRGVVLAALLGGAAVTLADAWLGTAPSAATTCLPAGCAGLAAFLAARERRPVAVP